MHSRRTRVLRPPATKPFSTGLRGTRHHARRGPLPLTARARSALASLAAPKEVAEGNFFAEVLATITIPTAVPADTVQQHAPLAARVTQAHIDPVEVKS